MKLRNLLVGMQAGSARSHRLWYNSKYLKPGTRRWVKKQSHRKMRRLAKQNPAEAPQEYHYSGYSD